MEAVDRVAAVTTGRPSTPLQTSWFEFLLDSSLLEKHLQESNSGDLSLTSITRCLVVDLWWSLNQITTPILE